jgi:hypothetical protein
MLSRVALFMLKLPRWVGRRLRLERAAGKAGTDLGERCIKHK